MAVFLMQFVFALVIDSVYEFHCKTRDSHTSDLI